MPPKTGRHQNTTAWVAHQHQDDKKLTADILRGSTEACCEKCVEVIEWRQKYGKYRPLSKATKCHLCQQKTVIKAYHGLCQACSKQRKLCAKCEKPHEGDTGEAERYAKEQELRQQLVHLPERYRRSAERKLDRGEDLAEVERVIQRALGKRSRKAEEDAASSSGDEAEAPAKPAAQPPAASSSSSPAAAPPATAAAAGADDDSDSDEVI